MENPIIRFRIPVDLLKRLERLAKQETRTVPNLVVAIITEALPQREKAAR